MTRRSLVALVAAATISGLAPVAAFGHASPVGTSPAAGSSVERFPPIVTVTFDQILGAVTSVRLIDGVGRNHVAQAGLDPRDARRIVVRTARPVAGRLELRWSVVATDGHVQGGTVAFRVKRR